MRFLLAFILFIARLGLAVLFVAAGIGKIMGYDQTVAYMASKGMTAIPFFLFGAIIVEIFGGLGLIFGIKTRLTAMVLFLFLIPATLIFHDFWNLQGLEYTIEQIMFMKNLAIMGGLLYVVCYGAGGCSWDAYRRHKPVVVVPVEEKPL